MKTNRKFKKPETPSKLVLEEIIGLTTKNGNGLASNISTANCAYLAGCVVVVYNVNSGTQSHLMVSHRAPKPLSCVAMSKDGRFIAAGESGTQPSVLVWDSATLAFSAELKGHLYGISCISFSSDGKHLVSVGGYIYLWEWRNGALLTKLKASSSCHAVSSVSFSSDAKFIVTAGKKHLKFWAVGSSSRSHLNARTGLSAMQGKPVNLDLQKGSSFISVAYAIWGNTGSTNCKSADSCFPIYALTDAGILWIIHSGLSIRKSVDLKVKKSFALSISNKLIACACNAGIVQMFSRDTLKYEGTVVYSKAKSYHEETDIVPEQDFQQLLPCQMQLLVSSQPLKSLVSTQASQCDGELVVYGDHSLYIWDIHDLNKATRCFVLVSHAACIWDIKNLCCENMHDSSLACVARGCSGGVSFATCSADGTIRLWDLALQSDLSEKDAEYHSLQTDLTGTTRLVSAGVFERDAVEADISTRGFRSLAVSSDGKYLAAGDCEGNIHIYNLQTSEFLCLQGAHDAEILTLSFSLATQKDIVSKETTNDNYYLASGSRDRIIHLYNVKRNFDRIKSIGNHSAAVTSVKVAGNSCKVLSCSADRSLMLCDVTLTDSGHKISRCHHQMTSHGTLYDMAVDPKFEVAVTVGQDKKINTFDIASGKLIRSYKQDKDFGDPIKVTMDPSCTYLVCSYSNKSICIYDFITGDVVMQALGHSEVITGVIFLPDCKHIVSVGGDGCVFVWKVPALMSTRILERITEKQTPLSPRSLAQPVAFSHIILGEEEDQQYKINSEEVWSLGSNRQSRGGPRETSAFKFSVSRLPHWAKAKVTSSNIVQGDLKLTSSQGYASPTPEVQMPSDHALGGSSSCNSISSRSSPDTGNFQTTFTMDNRWLTVYTVCMDLLNSPEIRNLMDTKMSKASSILIQDKTGISKDKYGLGRRSQGQDDKQGVNLNHHASCSNMKATTGINFCNPHSEGGDIFEQHFGSLSTINKIERRKSSMRRYSARYVLKQDYLGGCRRLFGTPDKGMASKTKNCKEETSTHVKSENPLEDSWKQQELKNPAQSSVDSDYTSSICELTRCQVNEKAIYMEKSNCRDQKECLPQVGEVQKTVIACKEALLSLNAAADTAAHMFAKLGILGYSDEFLGEAGVKLFDEAAELLPLITEKVNKVARLVCSQNNDSCGSRADISGMEPLLGTFAESLSDKILEMLKENLCTV
ncbi:mitogen-activated protein kinase-binding protein 1 isoform X1 [Quillaja saponaria]|uniref:Mitogen-activated protein kinase-binding protein 1 isoform X1 n=1 Tax=Quillaja saponaria TaxID=32244 RepID=A0AAD7LN96_QUISA|nr:mitogen-activated protein kinase-binding protein 1 isoform X1 [Quillaja saponaria]